MAYQHLCRFIVFVVHLFACLHCFQHSGFLFPLSLLLNKINFYCWTTAKEKERMYEVIRANIRCDCIDFIYDPSNGTQLLSYIICFSTLLKFTVQKMHFNVFHHFFYRISSRFEYFFALLNILWLFYFYILFRICIELSNCRMFYHCFIFKAVVSSVNWKEIPT